ERRQLHELDGNAGCERRLAAAGHREEDELRPEALAAGRERLVADGGDDARVGRHGSGEAFLEGVEVALETRHRPDLGEGGHAAVPTCSATIPPAKRSNRTSSNPFRCNSAASSAGAGKRRTLAGRYV